MKRKTVTKAQLAARKQSFKYLVAHCTSNSGKTVTKVQFAARKQSLKHPVAHCTGHSEEENSHNTTCGKVQISRSAKDSSGQLTGRDCLHVYSWPMNGTALRPADRQGPSVCLSLADEWNRSAAESVHREASFQAKNFAYGNLLASKASNCNHLSHVLLLLLLGGGGDFWRSKPLESSVIIIKYLRK